MIDSAEKPKRRSFGGKLNNFIDRQESNFEKAHLRAYLRGDKYFFRGFVTNAFGNREPIRHIVNEIWS